ncbi:site-specific tyrosine recombinase/integron integrase [Fervidobacterium thailandense]|uniref:Recombinase XerC n=1 Tax=Fervidobacterium thailandense TaxID=1008305 RepID=A0A1E3G3I5_9BACT|nr:site-specific tyrosine recombinase/integron integrase [Fervidobacterium thailandense]ODN30814.1 recombinase XerC [Fervidobacterium thailandense]
MDRLVEAFEDYLGHVRRCSENTLKAYMKDVRRFLEYTQKHPRDVSRNDVEGFIKALSKGMITGGEVTESTISRYISSLRVFFDYLHLIGVVSENPMEKVRHPRLRKKVPNFLSIEEVRAMLNAFDERKIKYKAILSLLYFCGLRVGELCNLRVEDVSFYPPYVKVVMGKGNKDRIVPISESALNVLEAYVERYRPRIYFFEGRAGKPIHPATVFRVVKRAAKKAGVTKNIHPHTLRHSFATHLIMNNVNVKIVQELLGHANLSTTSIYLHVADREKFEAVKRLVI